MSKYNKLWIYIYDCDETQQILTFDEISEIAGVPLDHSFLKYKKELRDYGYEIAKISMKTQSVHFVKL